MSRRASPLRALTRWTFIAFAAAATVYACQGSLREPAPAPVVPDPSRWDRDTLNVAYLGHASVLIGFGEVRLLTDPAFYDRIGLSIGPLTVGPKRLVRSALGPDALPPLHAVLLSHAHMDSLDRPSLGALDAPLVVVPERTGDLVDDLGFGRVVELRWGQRVEIGDVTVEAVPLAHWGRRWPWEGWRGYNGYLLTRGDVTVLFASDTAYTPALGALGKKQPITAAIIGNGAYDPWVRNHATPEQVWQMFRETGASWLLPIHWDTFRLGKEPVGDAMHRLVAAAGKDTERIVFRRIGETWTLRENGSAARR